MEIFKIKDDTNLTIVLEGELNTITAPDLEKVIKDNLSSIKLLVLDFGKLEYLSSAGLRVLLIAQKIMDSQGKMIVKNVNSTIMDIFEMTGFSNILSFE